jgi:hypothetical protein
LQEGDKENWREEVQFRSLDSVKRRINGGHPFGQSISSVAVRLKEVPKK